MNQYLEALEYILENGETVSDRTGVGTKSVFGYQMRFNLQKGFPAVTTKKLAWKSVVGELLWFLEGSSDERRLAEITFEDNRENLIDKKTIWTANADNQGKALGYANNDGRKELGPVYGVQWVNFNHNYSETSDQISTIIHQLKNDPDSRRIILNAWNPNQIEDMALPPCHVMSQFKVNTYTLEKRIEWFNKNSTYEQQEYFSHECVFVGDSHLEESNKIDEELHIEGLLDSLNVPKGKLSCQMYQRSADMFLGVPFNIASYSLLTHMLAQICDLEVGEFIHVIGDAHIYLNHIDQVKEQLQRTPGTLPELSMPEFKDLNELLATKPSDYKLNNYNPMPSIKAPMAV